MDKESWRSIKENDFALPVGSTASSLIGELFALTGLTDPELRDEIGLEVFYHWLIRDLFMAEELRSFVPRLLANLQQGLGEEDGDGVFLRSFSALWLGCLVEYDREKNVLNQEMVLSILEAALAYFPLERDLRGYVPVKGWAHAIAHTADLFLHLARNPHLGAVEHRRILDCVAAKLMATTNWIFLYGEEARLARVAISVFLRETLSLEEVREWLKSLAASWQGAWLEEGRARAYHNGLGFLRSLHYRIPLLKVDVVPQKEEILKMIVETLEGAEPWK
jgi:hypothetical protein